MINLTRLLCDVPQPADALRYGVGHAAPRSAAERKPIVVWNITRRCNLRCAHCYSSSTSRHYPGELTLPQFRATIDDLAEFGVEGTELFGHHEGLGVADDGAAKGDALAVAAGEAADGAVEHVVDP